MKKTKITKRIVSLALVFLLSINSFAATMGDNDGSAFITKAEFDSLKNNFQTQLDAYNTGIDSKIDAAIAGYLSGIGISNEPSNLFDSFVAATGQKPYWVQTINAGSESTSSLSVQGVLSELIESCNNMRWLLFSGVSERFYSIINIGGGDMHTHGTASRNMITVHADVNTNFNTISWGTGRTNNYNSASYPITYGTKIFSQQFGQTKTGSGQKWLYQKEGSRKYLKKYCNVWYPEVRVTYKGHLYKKFTLGTTQDSKEAAYFADNGKAIADAPTTSPLIVDIDPNTKKTAGSIHSDGDNAKTNWGYLEADSIIVKADDGANYLSTFFSITSSKKIYAFDEEYQGDAGSTTSRKEYTIDDQKYTDLYYTQSGAVNQLNNVKGPNFKYGDIVLSGNTVQTEINTFCNEVASNIISEDVFIGGGMPIVEVFDKEKSFKINIKLSSAANNSCNVKIASEQFKYGSVDVANLIEEKTITANAASATSFTINPNDTGLLWIFLKNVTNTDPITIESITLVNS